MDNAGLAPCSHEQADSRMMVHVAHAANTYNNILIRTVDSDVVVLAVYAFAQLTSSPNELWVAFGTGKHYRLIPAHKICAAIGLDKCLARFLCSMHSLDVTRILVFLEEVSELRGIPGTCTQKQPDNSHH